MSDFQRRIDLAAERLGGAVLWATDEFFAPKENLLRAGRAEFIPGKYTDRGKWMDGWESRRRRDTGHDACIVRLGLPGVVRGVDVDTLHFKGNAPKSCRIEALRAEGYQPLAMLQRDGVAWTEVLPERGLTPDSQNLFAVDSREPWTHLRLHIYPDGGVARLRVFGDVAPDWTRLLAEHNVLDLAAVEHGGVVLAANDEFFSERRNLILPGPSVNMGDGWETRRKRGPGHDWVVLRLGRPGTVRRFEVDTTHFKGNYPDGCSIEACYAPQAGDAVEALGTAETPWREVLPRTPLEAHTRHEFAAHGAGAVTHLRLNIYPDGGVARLRVFGEPERP